MAIFNFSVGRSLRDLPGRGAATYEQHGDKAGLLVTDELEKAIEDCKRRVVEVSKQCRAANCKFRDPEFDIENHRSLCLNTLTGSQIDTPADIQRITQIFDNPRFFADGEHASSGDIVQGRLGDCWFLASLITCSTMPGLVERFCVARDELVGVYGFIFFHDNAWETVVVDDLLYTEMPRYEQLDPEDRRKLFFNNKSAYNKSRKSGKSLFFARSGEQGESWVPLVEKAYAKLHGDYKSLEGGYTREGVEDLTGGVSVYLSIKDILDVDRFWNEEFLFAAKDRVFSSSLNIEFANEKNDFDTESGLVSNHAYAILRAIEIKGKRFVVLRNPWGETEWKGAWSDGSKEWTKEWVEVLPELKHVFGNDGQFVMEYKDWLENFDYVERTLILDSSWVMSSQWLNVNTRPLYSAWSYGDVSFTFNVKEATDAIIVLAELDSRYFTDLKGPISWSFDFMLFKKGELEPVGKSSEAWPLARSTSLETKLLAGDYVVHVS
ncbi:cysteine proteinase [Fistulina hepatica ATCC 64428]|uniref:Cysteine proteinase n=1 Tax=Fistulina hepatica ATCC 64428 TaxID=1128425 RepID=A0A0D7A591_9AGAR|nr:cysteine proteinase [Fistulina hepatica ATCC 64428]